MKYLIGVGNYSMYDDSIGLRLVEYISEKELDQQHGFEAIELGGNLLNVLSYFTPEVEEILLVDTIKDTKMSGHQSSYQSSYPGEYIFFTPKEVESTKDLANISTHEGDIIKVLALARETGYKIPPIKVMGIFPLEIKNDMGLSPLLSAHLPHYANRAISELVEN